MAVQTYISTSTRKLNSNLDNFSADIVETTEHSKYFNIFKVQEEYGKGVHTVVIRGSEELKKGTYIFIDIVDERGNAIPINVPPQYESYEQKLLPNRRFTFEIDDSNRNGTGRMIFVGTTKNGDKVKFEKSFSINTSIDSYALNNRGQWTIDTFYEVGDVVQYSGSSYTTILAHDSANDNNPPDPTYWEILAEGGSGITFYVTGTNGTVFKNNQGTTDLEAKLFDGGTTETATAYRWYKDGNLLASETGSVLTVNAVDVDSKASYTVEADYDGNTYEYTQAVIDVADGESPVTPFINTPDGIVFKNGTGTIDLVAELFESGTSVSTGSITYQWYQDGSALTSETASTITIVGADIQTSSVYRVDQTYNGVTYDAYETVFDVFDGESIRAIIESGVDEGFRFKNSEGTLTLTGSLYEGADLLTAGLTYQWYKNGVSLAGETSRFLSVTPADINIKEVYEVDINDGGRVYDARQDILDVTDGAGLYIEASNGFQFKNNTGSSDLTARLYEGGTEVTSGVTYSWTKDGGAEFATTKTITVNAGDFTNSAVYEVTATHKGKTYSFSQIMTDIEDGYTPVLSNEVGFVQFDAQGGEDYSNATTEFDILRGGTEVTSDFTLSVASDSGNVTYNFNVSTGVLDITDIPEGATGFVVLQAVKGSLTLTKRFGVQTVSEGATGSTGQDAKAVSLRANQYAVKFDSDGTKSASNNPITLSASAQNHDGTVFYEFVKDDTTVLNNDQDSFYTLSASQEPALGEIAEYEVRTREGASSGTIIAIDTISIFAVKDGDNAITVIMTNESHTYPADNTGTVSNYGGGETRILVYEGSTKLNHTLSAPADGQYRVTTGSVTGIDAGTVQTVNNEAFVGAPSNFTALSASVDYNIEVNPLFGSNNTFVKTQSFTKSIKGDKGDAGADGKRGVTYIFKGLWNSGSTYTYDDEVASDVVLFDDGNGDKYYYLSGSADFTSLNESPANSASNDWTTFEGQFKSVATDILLAQDVTIRRSLTMGDATQESEPYGSTGIIRSLGFFGDDGNVYYDPAFFSGSAQRFYELDYTGISAISGSFGNWKIFKNTIESVDAGGGIRLDSQNQLIEVISGSNTNVFISNDLQYEATTVDQLGTTSNPTGTATFTDTGDGAGATYTSSVVSVQNSNKPVEWGFNLDSTGTFQTYTATVELVGSSNGFSSSTVLKTKTFDYDGSGSPQTRYIAYNTENYTETRLEITLDRALNVSDTFTVTSGTDSDGGDVSFTYDGATETYSLSSNLDLGTTSSIIANNISNGNLALQAVHEGGGTIRVYAEAGASDTGKNFSISDVSAGVTFGDASGTMAEQSPSFVEIGSFEVKEYDPEISLTPNGLYIRSTPNLFTRLGAGYDIGTEGSVITGGGGAGSTIDWSNVTNKPSTFTPSAHTHPSSEITDFTSAVQNTIAPDADFQNLGTGDIAQFSELNIIGIGDQIATLQTSDDGAIYLGYQNSSQARQGYIGYGSGISGNLEVVNENGGSVRIAPNLTIDDLLTVNGTQIFNLGNEQNLSTNANPTFNNLELTGTINYANETNLQVEDKTITLNKNGTDGSSEGSGIIIERPSGDESLLWGSGSMFNFSDGISISGSSFVDINKNVDANGLNVNADLITMDSVSLIEKADFGGGYSNFYIAGFDTLLGRYGDATTTDNIFVGPSAGRDVSGNRNIGIGASAMQSAGNGTDSVSRSVAIGNSSMQSALNVTNNIAIGEFTLRNATTGGNYNVAIGGRSLWNANGAGSNTAIGYSSLADNISGDTNTAIGGYSLNNALGSSNTAIGFNAGRSIVGGADNINVDESIYIGRDTLASADGNVNEIVIGYLAEGNGSNTVTIGHTTIAQTYLEGDLFLNDTRIFTDGDEQALGTTDDVAFRTITLNGTQLFTFGEEQALGTGDTPTFAGITSILSQQDDYTRVITSNDSGVFGKIEKEELLHQDKNFEFGSKGGRGTPPQPFTGVRFNSEFYHVNPKLLTGAEDLLYNIDRKINNGDLNATINLSSGVTGSADRIFDGDYANNNLEITTTNLDPNNSNTWETIEIVGNTTSTRIAGYLYWDGASVLIGAREGWGRISDPSSHNLITEFSFEVRDETDGTWYETATYSGSGLSLSETFSFHPIDVASYDAGLRHASGIRLTIKNAIPYSGADHIKLGIFSLFNTFPNNKISNAVQSLSQRGGTGYGDYTFYGDISIRDLITVNGTTLFTLGEEQALGINDSVNFTNVDVSNDISVGNYLRIGSQASAETIYRNVNNDMVFTSAGVGNDRMTIYNAGNVEVHNGFIVNGTQLFTIGEEQALGTGDNVDFNTVTVTGGLIDITGGSATLVLQDTTDDDDFSVQFKNDIGETIWRLGDAGNNRFTFSSSVNRDWEFEGGQVGIGTPTPSAKLDVNGTSQFQDDITFLTQINSDDYTSGILGAGSILNNDASEGSFFEVDNMRIRSTLRTHIFKKDIVRASNGLLYISDASEIADAVTTPATTGTSFIIRVKEAVFSTNDEITYKDADENTGTINEVVATITDNGTSETLNSQTVYAYSASLDSGTSVTLRAGDTVVRTSGGTILLDASTANSPFIDIHDGTSVRARVGNLDGISDTINGQAVSGYGLYSDNAFLKGGIVATYGAIGAWDINSTTISGGNLVLDSSGEIRNTTQINTQNAYELRNDGTGQLAGGNVTWDASGNLTITGEITATTGAIGGFTIGATELTATNIRLDSADAVVSVGTGTDAYNSANRIYLDGDNDQMSIGTGFRYSSNNLTIDGNATIAGWSINSDVISRIFGSSVLEIGSMTTSSATGFEITDSNNAKGEFVVDANGDLRIQAQSGSTELFYVGTTSNHGFTAGEMNVLIQSGGNTVFQAGAGGNTFAGWTFTNTELASSNRNGGGDGSYTTDGIVLNSGGFISTPNFYVDLAGNASFAGNLDAPSGTIGGWTIATNSIYTGTEDVDGGYSSNGITLSASGAIHAPEFYINSAGNASFAGSLDAPSGNIGGWSISGNTLTSNQVTIDANTNNGEFRVGTNGDFWNGNNAFQFGGGSGISYNGTGNITIGTGAVFEGQLSAPSGNIGGWTINNTSLTAGVTTLSGSGYVSFGSNFVWNGTNLTIDGSAEIAGWQIGSTVISSTTGNIDLDSAGVINIGSGTNGLGNANNIYLSGNSNEFSVGANLTYTSDTLVAGGWTIGSNVLDSTDANGGITLDSTNKLISVFSASAELVFISSDNSYEPTTVTQIGTTNNPTGTEDFQASNQVDTNVSNTDILNKPIEWEFDLDSTITAPSTYQVTVELHGSTDGFSGSDDTLATRTFNYDEDGVAVTETIAYNSENYTQTRLRLILDSYINVSDTFTVSGNSTQSGEVDFTYDGDTESYSVSSGLGTGGVLAGIINNNTTFPIQVVHEGSGVYRVYATIAGQVNVAFSISDSSTSPSGMTFSDSTGTMADGGKNFISIGNFAVKQYDPEISLTPNGLYIRSTPNLFRRIGAGYDILGTTQVTSGGGGGTGTTIAWGDITGTLSNQTDLQSVLNDKADDTITISGGGGLTGGGNLTANRTISHADTSTQGDVTNTAGRYVSGVDLDTYGHVVGLNTRSISGGTGITVTGDSIAIDSTVIQSGDNITELINNAGYITSYPVDSVFGRTGAVVAELGDYSFSQISGTIANGQLPATQTGKTFSSEVTIEASVPRLNFNETDNTNDNFELYLNTGVFSIREVNDSDVLQTVAMSLDANTNEATFNYALYEGTDRVFTEGSIASGTGISISGLTISHGDTSTMSDVTSSANDYISGIDVDGFGHVQSVTRRTLTGGTAISIGTDTVNIAFDSLGFLGAEPASNDEFLIFDTDASTYKKVIYSDFDAPVDSVNGQTGVVSLSATDVNAVPDTGGTINGSLLIESATDGKLNLRASDSGGTGGTADGAWNYIQFQDAQGDRQGYFGIDPSGNFQFTTEVTGAIVEVETSMSVNGSITFANGGSISDVSTTSTQIQANGDNLEVWDESNSSRLFDVSSSLIRYKAFTIWHSGNDGASSGLNADLLDGNHASAFALDSHNHTSGDITDFSTAVQGVVAPDADFQPLGTGDNVSFNDVTIQNSSALYFMGAGASTENYRWVLSSGDLTLARVDDTKTFNGTLLTVTYSTQTINVAGTATLNYGGNEVATQNYVDTNSDNYQFFTVSDGVSSTNISSLDTLTFSNGSGVTVGEATGTITVAHADTSAMADVTSSANDYISGIDVDSFGHVQSVTRRTLTGGTAISMGTDTVNVSFDSLGFLGAEPASNDELLILDTSAGTYKKLSYSNIDAPVDSVNGNTGAVSLGASDLNNVTGSPTNGTFLVGDGSNFVGESGNTARTSLGLGTGDDVTFNSLDSSGNISVTGAGWGIFPNRVGIGGTGVPNITGDALQVDGGVLTTDAFKWYSGSTVNYSMYTSGTGERLAILRNFDSGDSATLLELRSRAGSPTVDDREATLALTRTDDSGNSEFLDLFNNGYHSASTEIAVVHGINIQKRGTGEWRPFLFGYDDGTTYNRMFTVNPPDSGNNVDFEVSLVVSGSITFLGGGSIGDVGTTSTQIQANGDNLEVWDESNSTQLFNVSSSNIRYKTWNIWHGGNLISTTPSNRDVFVYDGGASEWSNRALVVADISDLGSYDDYGSWNFQVNTGTTEAITSGDTLNFVQGSGITLTKGADQITIATDFSDTNNYVTSIAFNDGNGDLTLTRAGLTDLTDNLDGRYALVGGDTFTGGITVQGDVKLEYNQPTLYFNESDTTDDNFRFILAGGTLSLQRTSDAGVSQGSIFDITHSTSTTNFSGTLNYGGNEVATQSYVTTNSDLYNYFTISDGTNSTNIGSQSTLTMSAGSGISVSESAGTVTTSHSDTSTMTDVTSSANDYISGIDVDGFGHVQSVTRRTLTGGTAISIGTDTVNIAFDSLGFLGAEPASNDELLILDTSVGTYKKVAYSNIDAPVDSVNGNTGAVSLTAGDVDAVSATNGGTFSSNVTFSDTANQIRIIDSDGGVDDKSWILQANGGVIQFISANDNWTADGTPLSLDHGDGTATFDGAIRALLGIDVDGGTLDINTGTPSLRFMESDTTDDNFRFILSGGTLSLQKVSDAGVSQGSIFDITHSTTTTNFSGTLNYGGDEVATRVWANGQFIASTTANNITIQNTQPRLIFDDTNGAIDADLSRYADRFEIYSDDRIELSVGTVGAEQIGISSTRVNLNAELAVGTNSTYDIFLAGGVLLKDYGDPSTNEGGAVYYQNDAWNFRGAGTGESTGTSNTSMNIYSGGGFKTVIHSGNIGTYADDYSSWSVSDGATSSTVSSGQTVQFIEGSGNVQISQSSRTVTIDATDSNDFVTGLSFNTTNGELTATIPNQLNRTVDLDGRYLLDTGDTITGELIIDYGSSPSIRFDNDSSSSYDMVISCNYDFDGWFRVTDGGGTTRFTVGRDGNLYQGGPGGNIVWHQGNDGGGSGLHADLLDGNHGSAFLLAGGDTVTGTLTYNGKMLLDADGTTYEFGQNDYDTNTGILLRTQVNPSSGNALFIVMSSGGSERLRVEHGGETYTSQAFTANGTVTGTEVTATSDARIKTDIKPLENALDAIRNINGYTYLKDGEESVGFVAQEVEGFTKNVVSSVKLKDYEYDDFRVMSTFGMQAYNTMAIKELDMALLSLDGTVMSNKERIEKLEEENERLKEELKKLKE